MKRGRNEDKKIGAYDILVNFKSMHQRIDDEFSRLNAMRTLKRPTRGQRITIMINNLLKTDNSKRGAAPNEAQRAMNEREVRVKRRPKSIIKPSMANSRAKPATPKLTTPPSKEKSGGPSTAKANITKKSSPQIAANA